MWALKSKVNKNIEIDHRPLWNYALFIYQISAVCRAALMEGLRFLILINTYLIVYQQTDQPVKLILQVKSTIKQPNTLITLRPSQAHGASLWLCCMIIHTFSCCNYTDQTLLPLWWYDYQPIQWIICKFQGKATSSHGVIFILLLVFVRRTLSLTCACVGCANTWRVHSKNE